MWVMGPFLKGAGAIAFLLDYLLRGSPASFLLFAASDGALALVTLWALKVDVDRAARGALGIVAGSRSELSWPDHSTATSACRGLRKKK